MSDPRKILQDKFNERNRYNNFGTPLMQMNIKGFRCHRNTVIDIKSPITAFCGLNGTGKSTILQLVAASSKNTNGNNYYLRDFFVVGSLDPSPYHEDARVIYKFWSKDGGERRLTLSRSPKSWSGYRRRPKKVCFLLVSGCFSRRLKSGILAYIKLPG